MSNNIIASSWSKFDPEYSKTYLHDADRSLPQVLAKEIFSICENPKIADVGCGNARFYRELSLHNKNFAYSGFDISQPLLDAANHAYSKNQNFNVTKISEDLREFPLDSNFDFIVSIHVAEICSSIEKLFYVMSKSRYSSIVWFEYPRFDYSELEIKEYVSHDNAKKQIYSPYLRNKYSKNMHSALLEMFSLEVVKQLHISEKDALVVYRRKGA